MLIIQLSRVRTSKFSRVLSAELLPAPCCIALKTAPICNLVGKDWPEIKHGKTSEEEKTGGLGWRMYERQKAITPDQIESVADCWWDGPSRTILATQPSRSPSRTDQKGKRAGLGLYDSPSRTRELYSFKHKLETWKFPWNKNWARRIHTPRITWNLTDSVGFSH